MFGRAGGFFDRILGNAQGISSSSPEIDESVIGETFSPDLFRKECAELGYSFEIFVDKNGKIYRFTRIVPQDADKNGDVW